jgi:hypothetical protein
MRIGLEVSGGFAAVPGLSRSIVVDTAEQPLSVASELDHLVLAAQLGSSLKVLPAPEGAADMLTYRLTVQRGDRTYVVQFTDAIPDQALQDLVARLEEIERAAR